MSLSRSEILQNDRANVPRVQVEIPEWGGSVYVRMMTAGERGRLIAEYRQREKQGITNEEAGALVIIATVCDESGQLLFGEADVPAILDFPYKALERLVHVALPFNGMGEESIETLKKTSENRPNGDSSSDSLSPSEDEVSRSGSKFSPASS